MERTLLRVRRNILLALLAASLTISLLYLVGGPATVAGFAPEAARLSRLLNLILAPLWVASLLVLVHRYLAPITQLGHLVRQGKDPLPAAAIRQARRVALDAPFHLFAITLGITILASLLGILIGAILTPSHWPSRHCFQALQLVATTAIVMLAWALLVRRQLKPALPFIARLRPSLDESDDPAHALDGTRGSIPMQQETLQREYQGLLILQQISSRVSTIFELGPLLDELVHSVRSNFGYHNALIYLADEEREELYLAASALPMPSEAQDSRFRIGSEQATARAARESLLIPDVGQDTRCTTSGPEVRAKICAPMRVGGRLVGILEVESERSNALGEQDVRLMTALANQAAAAIEAVHLLQGSQADAIALERRAHNLMLINRISTTLTSSLDADEILSMTVRHLVELSNVDYGGALIFEQDGAHGRIVAEHPVQTLGDVRLSFPRPVSVQRSLELGIPYAVEDATSHPLLEPLREQIAQLAVQSLLLVPLVARRDMIGILFLASQNQRRAFSDEETEICQTVASQAAVAVANARLLQHVQQQRRALSRKSQELTEESSKLDAILNNIADGLVVTDPAHRIILSNPAFREMSGLPSARSLQGGLLAESFPAAGLSRLTSQALEAPGRIFTENLEPPDGRVLLASATALRIPPPILEPEQEEQIAGVVAVLRDITHEVEVDRMKTDFISAVSHELRSPLTSILGFASLIQRDFRNWISPHVEANTTARQVAERILENLVIIEGQSLRLTRLINNVLDIAKMEAGQMEWRMDSTDLADIIKRASSAATPLAEEKGLPIQVNLPPDGLPAVRADMDRMVQVMTNLLSNAIKFTEHGQISISAHAPHVTSDGAIYPDNRNPDTDALTPGDWAVVSVTDTGTGIGPEEAPHIFDRFTQGGDTLTGKPQGTGLGLAICKEIIEQHGGRIWVRSKPGKGSTFSFALPVEPSHAMNPAADENPILPKRADNERGKHTSPEKASAS